MDGFELRYTDYSLADEQEAVRDAFREFFASECPTARVRAAEPLGYDAKLWRQLAELGAGTMGLPENAGGDGAGLIDLVIVAEEAGAALAPVPFAEHVAARAGYTVAAYHDVFFCVRAKLQAELYILTVVFDPKIHRGLDEEDRDLALGHD